MSEGTQEPVVDPQADPEPEGVIEVEHGGQKIKVAPVGVISAERKRARESTEQKIRAEFEPLRAKAAQADQLQADLQALAPHIDYLNRNPELLAKQPQQPDVPQVPDEEAEKFARDYELYTPNGTGLDLNRAKRIIAKQQTAISQAARQAAQEAVQPMVQTTAAAAAKNNFLWAASQKSADGSPLVDAQELLKTWATFPPELAAQPEVAQLILDSVVGRTVRSGRRPQRAENEPMFSEPAGGGQGVGYQISTPERRLAQNVGLTEKQWADTAKQYRPDDVNILGD